MKMNGFVKDQVMGEVTDVRSGKAAKTGKSYFSGKVEGREWNFSTKQFEPWTVNFVAFDKIAEAMEGQVVKGVALWAEGKKRAGKPFTTNAGKEYTPIDLTVRDWCLAGTCAADTESSEDTEPDFGE
jgi:hypothetical protein